MSVSGSTAPRGGGDILAVGFGATVAMWGIGYLARLPVVLAPPAAVLALLLGTLLCAGFIAGRSGTRGVWGGALSGGLTGLLNLLVLGSFLSTHDRPNALVPTAGLWVPGSIAISALLGAAGAFAGSRVRRANAGATDWTAVFTKVAVGATFLLLVAGGLVTSTQAGLAVVDWPRSYGYNMFLYPFSRMTGGIYYEHAHRLLGALVGLTTLTLVVHLTLVEPRRFVKRMAGVALVLVIVQGVLGGLRVTEKNVYLALVHGVTAQIFLSLLVAIAVVASRSWRQGPASARPEDGGAGEIRLAGIAVGALLVQIVLGAIQRHLALGLLVHVIFAFVVGALTIAAGARAWGAHQDEPLLKRCGLTMIYATGAQLGLGFCAWFARDAANTGAMSADWKVVLTTLHQGMGAALLAAAVTLRLFLSRYLASEATPSAR